MGGSRSTESGSADEDTYDLGQSISASVTNLITLRRVHAQLLSESILPLLVPVLFHHNI